MQKTSKTLKPKVDKTVDTFSSLDSEPTAWKTSKHVR
jgi:hypothetical protein